MRKWDEVRAARDSPFAALRYGSVAKELGFLEVALKAALEGLALDPTNHEDKNKWLYCLAGTTELDLNDRNGRQEHIEHARNYSRKHSE